MGVRIQMYAVDLLPFSRLLEQRVGEVLQLYAEHGTSDRNLAYSAKSGNTDNGFYAMPKKKGVFLMTGPGKMRRVNDGEWPAELDRRLQDALDGGSTYFFAWLLAALSSVPSIEFVKEITSGNRRWWVGSVLEYLNDSRRFPQQEIVRLASLFQRVLHDYDCGTSILTDDIEVADSIFPVRPEDNPDFSMSLWTADEAVFVVDLLRRTREQNPQFREPVGPVGIAPATDEEWNEWVHKMIDQILKIKRLTFDEMRIVTFIG